MPGLKGIIRITSADFADSITYLNPDLAGKAFELFFNSVPRFIDYGVEWEYRAEGGFTILLPEFNPNLNIYEFYVLLK